MYIYSEINILIRHLITEDGLKSMFLESNTVTFKKRKKCC